MINQVVFTPTTATIDARRDVMGDKEMLEASVKSLLKASSVESDTSDFSSNVHRGVVWFGVVWWGVVWCSVVSCGVVWCGVV